MAVTEYDHEPIRGLPGDLPAGERMIWQGAPDWRLFVRSALFGRWVSAYFALLTLVAIAQGSLFGAVATAIAGLVVVGLLNLFALMVARTTVYTLTNRRMVLRIGVALNKCINLPLGHIGAADLRVLSNEAGDIALTLTGPHRIGYAMLWPHARPFKFGDPQPMLRALPDAQRVAALLARASAAVAPIERAEQAIAPAAVKSGMQEAAA